jgi:hypothetical protein
MFSDRIPELMGRFTEKLADFIELEVGEYE